MSIWRTTASRDDLDDRVQILSGPALLTERLELDGFVKTPTTVLSQLL